MKTDDIRKLIKMLEESDIDEIEVTRWGRKVRVSKGNPNARTNRRTQVQIGEAPATAEAEPKAGDRAAESIQDVVEVKSPMVGTFYRAPTPEADPYVVEGSEVKAGQVLCIIEAMKLMNELESEYNGKIAKILVENAQPVEYNQTLFLLEEQ